ncbi:MAG: HPP family protein [Chloroflexota bacterium]
MKVINCMKRNVVSIPSTTSIREAASVFVNRHIGLLPITNENGEPVGVIGLRDLLSLELPDFVNFIGDVDFVHDFGAVETTRPPANVLDQPVTTLMRPVQTVYEDCGLLRAYALMLQHNLHDMPVITRKGKLVGIASRVDVGAAILSTWAKVE